MSPQAHDAPHNVNEVGEGAVPLRGTGPFSSQRAEAPCPTRPSHNLPPPPEAAGLESGPGAGVRRRRRVEAPALGVEGEIAELHVGEAQLGPAGGTKPQPDALAGEGVADMIIAALVREVPGGRDDLHLVVRGIDQRLVVLAEATRAVRQKSAGGCWSSTSRGARDYRCAASVRSAVVARRGWPTAVRRPRPSGRGACVRARRRPAAMPGA